eukprot:TRINITY_DN2294_c0_g1_i1.p1 TRINITY_DN2294_c0_g1~~TRINITY_DN2294_c0_g1_i1.p1  ORF type:complete len:182 (-),score=11.97 TRINITY_DN2294_c0_g1_i1:390-935(-)
MKVLMSKIFVLLFVIVVVTADDCAVRETACRLTCGSATEMKFGCEANRGAIVSSCVCASDNRRDTIPGIRNRDDDENDDDEGDDVDPEEWCFDKLPQSSYNGDEDGYACEQYKSWGACDERWLILGNYCRKTCFGCTCEDQMPPMFTCTQQASWGKCKSSWMQSNRYCERTCGFCGIPVED